MDYETQQEGWLEDQHADFEDFLSQRNWGEAKFILDNLDELGYNTTDMAQTWKRAVWVDKIQKMDGTTFSTPFDIVAAQMKVIGL